MKNNIVSKIVLGGFLLWMMLANPNHIIGQTTQNVEAASNKLEYRLLKLHYKNSLGEKGVTTCYYDKNGLMHRARWELLDGSRYSINYHTFNQAGQMTKKYREFSDGIRSTLIYDYNAQGLQIAEHFNRSDGVSGDVDYTYNQDSILQSANCNGLNGWFHGQITYRYNDKGVKVGSDIQQKGKPAGVINYTYNTDGSLNTEYWDFADSWNQTFTYQYETYQKKIWPSYTSANVFITNTAEFKVVKENYYYKNQPGGPSFYEYDNTGKLVKKVFERADKLRTQTTYEYDEAGLLKHSLRKYSTGKTANFAYTFNGNRLLTRRAYKSDDGTTGSETYQYDDKMYLVQGIYENMDGWLTGTITFQSHPNGVLRQGKFKGDKFDADIVFQSDSDGNIIKIHWTFSNGDSQTYTFEYQKQ